MPCANKQGTARPRPAAVLIKPEIWQQSIEELPSTRGRPKGSQHMLNTRRGPEQAHEPSGEVLPKPAATAIDKREGGPGDLSDRRWRAPYREKPAQWESL